MTVLAAAPPWRGSGPARHDARRPSEDCTMALIDLDRTTVLLGRTPVALDALLRDLPDDWVREPEGPGRWSAYDILGHLIQEIG